MKNLITFLVAVMLLCTVGSIAQAQSTGAATQPQIADDSRVMIRIADIPTPGATDVTAIAKREVIRQFMLRHPNYQIEPFTMPSFQGGGMDAGPLMAIAAGIPPHGIYVNFRQSSTYMKHGFLEPLEILLARVLSPNERLRQTDKYGKWLEDPTQVEINYALEQIRERSPAPAWEVIYRKDESGRSNQKHVWAMPTTTLVMALLYRRDLFSEAGLNPDRPPRDWDELMDMSRKLTRPELGRVGLALMGGENLSWGVATFLLSNGVQAVQPDENGTWRATYNTRGAAEAVEYVWRLLREPYERDGQKINETARLLTNEFKLMWERGQIAMSFGYLDEELLANINPQLVGVAPVPASNRGTRGSELNCRMMGVFSDSTPEQKLAMMRYLWYTTGPEAQEIRTRIYVDHGFGQFVSPNLLSKYGYDRILRQVPEAWKTAFSDALEHGVPEPYGSNTQSIYRYMSRPIYEALETDLSKMSYDERIATIEKFLDSSVYEVNTRVMGILTPEQLRNRRIVASIAVIAIVLVFSLGMVHVWRYFTSVAAPFEENRNKRGYIIGFVILAPAFLLTLTWMYLPLVMGSGIAFTNYRLVIESKVVYLDNFATVLYDPDFWMALGRTFYFVALTIGLGFWPPILLAILLDEVPTAFAKYFFRTVFYLPAIVSGVIMMFLWKQLYDPSAYGVLNQLYLSLNMLDGFTATLLKWLLLFFWLSLIYILFWLPIKIEDMARGVKVGMWAAAVALLGVTLWPFISGFNEQGITGMVAPLAATVGSFNLQPLRWVESPGMAMVCVVIPTVWAGAGSGCLLYLAALKTVPDELYEAADIDGATNWHKVFYITLPRLKYLIVIQFIAAVIGAFRGGTDFILALTGGGPANSTTILGLEIFIRTFMELEFGLGTAMAWLLGALLIGFTAYQLKMLSQAEFKTAGRN
mgnify:CR=1 FL=1